MTIASEAHDRGLAAQLQHERVGIDEHVLGLEVAADHNVLRFAGAERDQLARLVVDLLLRVGELVARRLRILPIAGFLIVGRGGCVVITLLRIG